MRERIELQESLVQEAVTRAMAEFAINDWDKVVELLFQAGDTSLTRGSDLASALSVLSGMLSVYLGYRGAFGSGDHGHDDAVEAAMKARKKLRKANGYSYP